MEEVWTGKEEQQRKNFIKQDQNQRSWLHRMFLRIPRQLQPVLLGQLMSLCLCGTAISSQFLSNENYNAPTAQNLPTYFFLLAIYGSKLVCKVADGRRTSEGVEAEERTGIKEEPEQNTEQDEEEKPSQLMTILRDRGWKYLALAFIDVEANFAMVYAYQFTTITAIQLLDCFTIPMVMLLSALFLSTRYRPKQFIAVGICLLGLSLTVYTDAFRGQGMQGGSNKLVGDLLCLLGTFLYAVANVAEEFLVKQYSRSEYLAMVGLFGFLLSSLQVALLEYRRLALFQWTSISAWMFGLFTGSMVCFYSLVSLVMRRASALLFNISVLTSDFYSLLTGVFLFGNEFDPLYAVAFLVIIAGTLLFNHNSAAGSTSVSASSTTVLSTSHPHPESIE